MTRTKVRHQHHRSRNRSLRTLHLLKLRKTRARRALIPQRRTPTRPSRARERLMGSRSRRRSHHNKAQRRNPCLSTIHQQPSLETKILVWYSASFRGSHCFPHMDTPSDFLRLGLGSQLYLIVYGRGTKVKSEKIGVISGYSLSLVCSWRSTCLLALQERDFSKADASPDWS